VTKDVTCFVHWRYFDGSPSYAMQDEEPQPTIAVAPEGEDETPSARIGEISLRIAADAKKQFATLPERCFCCDVEFNKSSSDTMVFYLTSGDRSQEIWMHAPCAHRLSFWLHHDSKALS
jgi:hypothetical protein